MSISLCIIVKNEERSLERCLRSVLNVVDEFIIVDTGSTDQTLDIVDRLSGQPEFGSKIKLFHYEWCGDFASARNYAVEHARGDFILQLDADEYLHPDDVELIKPSLKKMCKDIRKVYFFYMKIINETIDGRLQTTPESILRLWSNRSKIRYSRKCHESIDDSLKLVSNKQGFNINFRIMHDGYDTTLPSFVDKRKRNIALLNEMIAEDPYDQLSLYYFARDYSYFDKSKSINLLKRIEPLLDSPHKENARALIKEYSKQL
ncbi:glycosyltransferase family 2 protein [Metabacillus halosaccharovorans]|uniref:glycosyltransferase family 2 protein n=1 Tax=Bacillaceae TaxID=186817 RepID=UPI0004BA17E3|nr:glycosyltransferase family 2 protein [Bacillus sp. J37]